MDTDSDGDGRFAAEAPAITGNPGRETFDFGGAQATFMSLWNQPGTSGQTYHYEDPMTGEQGTLSFQNVAVIIGSPYADNLAADAQTAEIYGGDGNDTINAMMEPASYYLRGGTGNDRIIAGDGFNDINGNQGDDTIEGGEGGNSWLVGGQGDDSIVSYAGGDIVYGNLGNDTLVAGSGADTMRGGQGDDSVAGGAGGDWISGDLGHNTLSGGGGADIFHAGAGMDVVLDFNVQEGDRVQLDPGVQYAVRQQGADTVIDLSVGGEMILKNVQLSSLPAGWILSA